MASGVGEIRAGGEGVIERERVVLHEQVRLQFVDAEDAVERGLAGGVGRAGERERDDAAGIDGILLHDAADFEGVGAG